MKWIERPIPNLPGITHKPIKAYCDTTNRFTVQVFNVASCNGTPWEGMLRVGICFFRRPGVAHSQGEIVKNWTFLQELKESLFPGRLAIEVYPAGCELVDVAPMRWLWVFPAGAWLPFNLGATSDQLMSYADGDQPRIETLV